MSFKYINKNGKEHFEGDKNQRQCTCIHCNGTILVGEGYKILPTENDYKFLHITCKDLYSKNANKVQKQYKHNFTWDITLTTYTSEDSTALKNNNWIALSSKIVTITSNTRNNFNNYDFRIQKAIVIIKNGNEGTQKKFTYSNITMEALTKDIDKQSLLMGLYK